jgi:hypothetical protein
MQVAELLVLHVLVRLVYLIVNFLKCQQVVAVFRVLALPFVNVYAVDSSFRLLCFY